jgi:hypothetical protein
MSNRNPASLLVDSAGNIIGSSNDGSSYRLKVDALLSSSSGTSIDVEVVGTRGAAAVSYPEQLKVLERISAQLDIILNQLAEITGEESPLH